MTHNRRTPVRSWLTPRRIEQMLAIAPLNVELVVRSSLQLLEEEPRPSMALADRVCAHQDELLFCTQPHHGKLSRELLDFVSNVSAALLTHHVDTVVGAVESAPDGATAPNVVHVDFRTRTVGTSKQRRGRSA